MFPKTTCPEGGKTLAELLKVQPVMELWRAGPLALSLSRACLAQGRFCPVSPAQILFDSDGHMTLLPGRDGVEWVSGAAPECRLHPEDPPGESAAVYGICALFYQLLAGAPPDGAMDEGPLQRRRRLRRLTGGLALPEAGSAALTALLDRGLRLEPSRRYASLMELCSALDALAALLDGEARRTLRLKGVSGALAGRVLSLELPVALGRRPRDCGLLFPPDTPGVSRRHCKLELRWGTVLVTDLGASYGTFLDGTRLEAGVPAPWTPGAELRLGSERQALVLEPI